jgi:hypothetical protein
LIDLSVQAARRAGIRIGICGEMASSLELTPLMIGLGLNLFGAVLLKGKEEYIISTCICIDRIISFVFTFALIRGQQKIAFRKRSLDSLEVLRVLLTLLSSFYLKGASYKESYHSFISLVFVFWGYNVVSIHGSEHGACSSIERQS